jgi:hypothetical protein
MEARADNSEAVDSLVAIEPGRASVPILLGAVEAALRSGLPGLRVRVPLDPGDSRHEALQALCGGDPRVTVAAPGEAAPEAEIAFALPARARPQPRTLPAIAGIVRDEGLASVEVPVPGRYVSLGRLGGQGRLRARAGGTGTKVLRPAEVGLRSTSSGGEAGAPPKGSLAAERAEHLRHRARAATMRARLDRNGHRLSRERLQTRHERARLRLAEHRLADTGAGEWVRWRSRAVARRAATAPGAARSGASSIRSFARRARRFALDRWRSRGGEA